MKKFWREVQEYDDLLLFVVAVLGVLILLATAAITENWAVLPSAGFVLLATFAMYAWKNYKREIRHFQKTLELMARWAEAEAALKAEREKK